MTKLRRFFTDETGPTAVEYAVMLAMVIMVCLAAITAVGQQTAQLWGDNNTQISSAMNP